MNIGIPITIFILLLIGIIALQVLYYLKLKKGFLISSFVLSTVSIIISLMTATYYNVALKRIEHDPFAALSNMAEYQDKLQNFGHYSIICIFAALIFFISIIITVAIILFKKYLSDKDELKLSYDTNQSIK